MSNRVDRPAELKSFRPDGIQRVIETASEHGHPTPNDIGLMAARELRRLATLPPSLTRDTEIADTCQTVEDVLQEKRKRRERKENSNGLAGFFKRLMSFLTIKPTKEK